MSSQKDASTSSPTSNSAPFTLQSAPPPFATSLRHSKTRTGIRGDDYSCSSSVASSIAAQTAPITVLERRPNYLSANRSLPAAQTKDIADEKGRVHLIDDDRLADITLIGKDGAQVRAIKYVLACRCAALKEKLYRDPSKQEFFMGPYSEAAILALKEYCHTGIIRNSNLLKRKSEMSARGIVEIATLAEGYSFDALYGEADSIIYEFVSAAPWFATACFDAVGSETMLIGEFLRSFIDRRCPDLLLETNALKYVSCQRLSALLAVVSSSNDYEKLQYLEKWVELKGSTSENIKAAQTVAAGHVSLKTLMANPAMTSPVRKSGLFPHLDSKTWDAALSSEEDNQVLNIYDVSLPRPRRFDASPTRSSKTQRGQNEEQKASKFDVSYSECLLPILSSAQTPKECARETPRVRLKKTSEPSGRREGNYCCQLTLQGEVMYFELESD
jgi:hypothetical protein